jgi:hypothetical protein
MRILPGFKEMPGPSPPAPLPGGEGSVERIRFVDRFRNIQ